MYMFWGKGSRGERKILMFVKFKDGTTLVWGHPFSRSDLRPFQPMIAGVGILLPVSGCFFLHVHYIVGGQFVSFMNMKHQARRTKGWQG